LCWLGFWSNYRDQIRRLRTADSASHPLVDGDSAAVGRDERRTYLETDVKRKYREAMRDKADRMRSLLDEDEEAVEARDWHDEWVKSNDEREQKTESQQ
jgi:hypothetical protein